MTFSFLWNTPKIPKKTTNMGPSHWGPNGKTTLGRPFGSSSQRQDIYSSKLTITRTSKMLQQQDPAGFQEWGIPFRKFPILWAIKFEPSKKSSEYDGEDPGPLDGAETFNQQHQQPKNRRVCRCGIHHFSCGDSLQS
jgi:hypothetical protein